jgi:protein-tyrosine phosphatase
MPVSVLFVCAGNICRSPMAEAVFQRLVDEAGLSGQFTLDSAGTGDWHRGQPADSRTLRVLEQKGIAYEGRARQLSRSDLSQFDYVLVMDEDNLANVRRLAGGKQRNVSLFLEAAVADGTVQHDEVPDPYYDGTFDRVYDLCLKGGTALLARIRKERGL